MFKKFFTYLVFLITFLAFVVAMMFGAIVKYHYEGGKEYQSLQKTILFISSIPKTINILIENRDISGDFIEPINDIIHDDKKIFDKKLDTASTHHENLILVSRHDGDLGRSIVEIRDLNTFEVLHSYLPDIEKIYDKMNLPEEELKNLIKDHGVNRYFMWHPAITTLGELIFKSVGPLVKIDFNSNVIWVNNDSKYRHSIELDDEENIYAPSLYLPYSKVIDKYIGLKNGNEKFNFEDDAINILDSNGKTLFSKSVTKILIENGYINRIFSQQSHKYDPIHINDIQPVLKDTQYFKKGDVFLSLRNLSMIVLYRPSTNKIIKVIEGEFYNQHDVDILDDRRISIYNNNVFLDFKDKRKVKDNNEIIIYNFETDTFSKMFEKTFIENKINTNTHGLVDFLIDGSALVEDRNNGRILYINDQGEVVWIFHNLSSKKQIYDLWWARVINLQKSKAIRHLIKK